ncbi:MAG TPA: RagB/SusD family nutrient uptake outer membrane protein [Gemmatimonadaceae bacterium]|nr:RagB/SusD family nutrient uptake outer membrane protein [Gemmatimonadaceae bacterium]
MTTLSRWMRATVLTGVAVIGLASCSMNVDNPSVIDAGKFNPNSDGATLALSAQTNFYIAFQSVAMFGGLISDEVWTGAVRLQTNRLSARNFASTDDINADFFAPLSLAIASNQNAVGVLGKGPNASTDTNLATAAMNLGFSLDLMAETMCSGVIQGGPELSDTQLLDTAITAFTQAITVASAAGPAGATIVNGSNVGLARAYLQLGDFANAATTAALVPSDFLINVVTSANVSTQSVLGNTYFGNALQGQIIAPKLYRIADPRMPIDSTTPGSTLNQQPYVIQAKYTSYADPIRLGSGLEAQYIVAEAELHASGATGDAVTLINARRAAGGEGAYAGSTSDTLAVLGELLNQRARDFWMEGKKLGDLRRNPSVPLAAVLTDPVGAPFYTNSGGGPFGSNFCAPIPPEETNANPNF